MIEVVDWPSFGYGAGALAVSTYAWSARGPILRARDRLVDWLDRRAFARASTEQKLRQLAVGLDALDERVHELQKQAMRVTAARVAEREQYEHQVLQLTKALQRSMVQDAAWENYQRRKKGLPPLPIGRGTASRAIVPSSQPPTLRWCECGHTSWEHVIPRPAILVDGVPEAHCRSCTCSIFAPVT